VADHGWSGRGVAARAKGSGANVVVVEVEPRKAREAATDGFKVMPMSEAARIGDLSITVTGDISVIRGEHFAVTKDQAIVCNSGHFNVEFNLGALEGVAIGTANFNDNVDEYRTADGRTLCVLAEGCLINLSAAFGHPQKLWT
jgi:adenosylhomocysteinase